MELTAKLHLRLTVWNQKQTQHLFALFVMMDFSWVQMNYAMLAKACVNCALTDLHALHVRLAANL